MRRPVWTRRTPWWTSVQSAPLRRARRLNAKTDELVEEAQREYMRVQNCITFEKVHREGKLNVLPLNLELPPDPIQPEVPWRGLGWARSAKNETCSVGAGPATGPAGPASHRT